MPLANFLFWTWCSRKSMERQQSPV
jgi:hypothetical protein